MPQRLKSGTSSQVAFILSPERGDEGVRVAKSSERINHASDFEALDYLESERSEQEFFVDLETLLREYLQKPSLYRAHLNSEGNLTDANGLSLVEMCERANDKHFGTKRYERVKAETDGLKVLQKLYNNSSENDVVILAMPPGTREENFGDMSITNISLIKQVGKEEIIETYTVPSMFLSVESHIDILKRVANEIEVETDNINDNPRKDLVLASHPIRIPNGVEDGALDRIAFELGYENFHELKNVVRHALEVEGDSQANGRRAGLISYIAKQIVSFRGKRDKNGLIALGRTVRSVFALEATGGFEGMDYLTMIGKFKDYMHGFMYKQELDRSYNPKLSMTTFAKDPKLRHLWELHMLIQMSPEAQNRLEVSMCGGGGWNDMFNTKFGGEMTNLQNPSFLQDVLAKSESSEVEYDFDKDGTCKVCGKSSETVGKLGPCYICRGCDHDIRAQVE